QLLHTDFTGMSSHCEQHSHLDQVEWSTLTVEWNMVDKHTEKKILYTFEDSTARVNRDHSVVDRMGLLQSNASLQLHNVTVGDEGLYTCRVITPVVYTETTSLEVLGNPLSPPPLILIPEECILHLCIKDFCPEDVSVTWTKNGDTLLSGVFNTPPSLNINGLYSMFSFLRITPNKDDQGSEFRCRVVHIAQREPEERLFTLPHLHLTNGY
uniref:Ig-like domain-containing protein n=1 Tax=Seriola lalandi dorsalis TaxID=1841481 RepID=A0A3B4YBZ4_SERLL